jgi:hypothetical protein
MLWAPLTKIRAKIDEFLYFLKPSQFQAPQRTEQPDLPSVRSGAWTSCADHRRKPPQPASLWRLAWAFPEPAQKASMPPAQLIRSFLSPSVPPSVPPSVLLPVHPSVSPSVRRSAAHSQSLHWACAFPCFLCLQPQHRVPWPAQSWPSRVLSCGPATRAPHSRFTGSPSLPLQPPVTLAFLFSLQLLFCFRSVAGAVVRTFSNGRRVSFIRPLLVKSTSFFFSFGQIGGLVRGRSERERAL